MYQLTLKYLAVDRTQDRKSEHLYLNVPIERTNHDVVRTFEESVYLLTKQGSSNIFVYLRVLENTEIDTEIGQKCILSGGAYF